MAPVKVKRKSCKSRLESGGIDNFTREPSLCKQHRPVLSLFYTFDPS